ncbi:hypothetical protein QE432_000332 [Agrobacterium sp. SORGH_AS 745]|nr:hypothetical protein [Agrobacterium sp. SORGH_AS_0745]
MHEERPVGSKRRTNARQIVFRHAAAALEHGDSRIARQADGEGNEKGDGDDDKNRLQQSLDEETGHVFYLEERPDLARGMAGKALLGRISLIIRR